MKLTTNFKTQELVPSMIFNKYGEASKWFIDPRILEIIEAIRNRFGKPMTINNWDTGGHLQNRGYRTPDTTIGAWYSQHKFGRAVDFNVQGIATQEIYDDILENQDFYLSIGVTTIEDIEIAKTWTHLDIRNTEMDTLKIVRP